MKKILAMSACVVPLMVAPIAYGQTSAQSTAPAPSTTAPAPGSSQAPASTMPTTPPAGKTGASNSAGAGSMGANTTGANNSAAGNTDSALSSKATQAVTGTSVKDSVMGKTVYNEKDEKIGDVEDVVLGADGKATTYVIGAGGFLGMGQHSVAVPFDKVSQTNDKLILQGYTKDQLKALPEVKVTK